MRDSRVGIFWLGGLPKAEPARLHGSLGRSHRKCKGKEGKSDTERKKEIMG